MARYRTRPRLVDAVQMQYQGMLQTPIGGIGFGKGDWLITEEDGHQSVCRAEQFEARYEAVRTRKVAPLVLELERLQPILNEAYPEPEPFFRGDPGQAQEPVAEGSPERETLTTEPHDGYPMEVEL